MVPDPIDATEPSRAGHGSLLLDGASAGTPVGGTVCAHAVVALLDLLDEERVTGPDDLTALLDGAGVDRETRDAIERRVQRLQAHLSRAGRRRDELAALFACSRELAEQRDVEALLRSLVHRANDLLGADLTWLAEFDPATGELEVRTACGAVSAQLEGVRVPAGEGMAGFVATRRRPHCSTRYHVDPGFTHDLGADSALLAEGVVSALAVPLVAGDDVIGTLFVATRTETQFHPDQIGLLTAFADHGAVILQGARLLEQARTLAEAADDSRDRLAQHVDEMERAHHDHAELTECVLRGESTIRVAVTLARAMQREVIVLDEFGAPIAQSSDRLPVDGCWRHPDVAGAIAESRRTARFVSTSCPGVAGVVAVVAGPASLGALLVARSATRPSAREQKTLEDAARIVALLRLKQDALADAEDRVRGELLGDLVEPGSRTTDEMRARARGLDLDALRRIFVLSVGDHRRDAVRALARMTPRPVLSAEHAGVVVAIFAESRSVDADRVRNQVRPRIGSPTLVVEGPSLSSCDDVPGSYREARRCLSLLPALGIRDRAVTTAPYSLYLRLFEPEARDIDDFVRAVIGPVLDSDAERGTDLLNTVSAFAECNASTARAARALHLHPNTVVQRLDRITKLLGSRWREPDEFFRIQVAVRLHALRRHATTC
nr:helix-turn-helix domain-containing protein [Pseudonocardia sp. C8]